MCNSIDYSGRQCETLSLEMNLAAGQEIRSRVCMSESMLTAINSQRVCSLCWHSCLLTCCSTPCWPAHTPLPEMDCQGVGPGSEHSFFRLHKLLYSFSRNKNSPKKQTTAAAVKKKNLDYLTHLTWRSSFSFDPELDAPALWGEFAASWWSRFLHTGSDLLQGLIQS